ncbi:hypothetical protein [Secundilactobacillus paracollinoides]|uniref:hypothetical protein n=1 Tax=Secundilactobacillus paracollinoides TaxID=240427 RepID=UPI0007054621|nr:hypothetical protein [Secundilactobacillus paracollinoides]
MPELGIFARVRYTLAPCLAEHVSAMCEGSAVAFTARLPKTEKLGLDFLVRAHYTLTRASLGEHASMISQRKLELIEI